MNTQPKEDYIKVSPEEERNWIKQTHLIYGGLIGVGIVTIQPFFYQGELTGVAAHICVASFSLSIPILAALLLLNSEESFHKHISDSAIVAIAKAIGQLAALVGFVAGFWHINQYLGIMTLVGCFIGLVAYSAGSTTLFLRKTKSSTHKTKGE